MFMATKTINGNESNNKALVFEERKGDEIIARVLIQMLQRLSEQLVAHQVGVEHLPLE
jgi:hypothetical protein